MISKNDDSRVLIAWGLSGNALRHVSEVPRGLACDCRCIRCGRALLARQGPLRAAHFAHARVSDCDGGVESALHRLAKEIFGQMRSVSLPAYIFAREETIGPTKLEYSAVVRPQRRATFSRTETEPRWSGVIPDIVLWNGTRPLLVEIAVSHRVDEAKRALIANLDVPAIEVRLDPSDGMLTREELKAKLEDDVQSKHWLFHPRQRPHEVKYSQLRSQARNRWDQERRAGMQLLRATLKRSQRPRPTSSTSRTSMKDFLWWENQLARFLQQFNRLPSLDETKAMWERR